MNLKSAPEIGRLLSIQPNTVYRWAKRYDIPAIRGIGQLLFDYDVLIEKRGLQKFLELQAAGGVMPSRPVWNRRPDRTAKANQSPTQTTAIEPNQVNTTAA